MHYNITSDLINGISVHAKFNDLINSSLAHDIAEFNDVPGKQHYKLLAHFSSLFNK